MRTIAPFGQPLYMMAKPVGAKCNMKCQYCYYLEKSRLYPQQGGLMSDNVLEEFVRQYIESQTQPQVLFIWHGGEPLLRPLSFYRKVIELQRRYGRGRQIDNCLQTNGTLLTDEWCEFFKENGWLIGVSIDGTQEQHDHYRLTGNGQPSWQQVMHGIELLNIHGIEWNAMAVVSTANVGQPLEFYRFFKLNGCTFIQFTPIVERPSSRPDGLTLTPGMNSWVEKATDAHTTPQSITPQQWGCFLCSLYDEWVSHDVGHIFVQLFEATIANWAGVEPGLCTLSSHCGHAGVMEFNGDVYSCDHFVFPEYRLGNIRQQTLTEMMYGSQQQLFAQLKQGALPRQCRECRFLFACHGECPKNRFLNDCYGNPGLNYLCDGYRKYFEHVADDMDLFVQSYRQSLK